MDYAETEGNSIDEAIERALQLLGVSRDKVDIEIISNATRGLFGFGGRRAKVRATRRRPLALGGEKASASPTPATSRPRAPAGSTAAAPAPVAASAPPPATAAPRTASAQQPLAPRATSIAGSAAPHPDTAPGSAGPRPTPAPLDGEHRARTRRAHRDRALDGQPGRRSRSRRTTTECVW
jgi:pyruvate/2-oxoglutarate dehydrogenase complex dihydrolipoamide acyltransferase (E2) component